MAESSHPPNPDPAARIASNLSALRRRIVEACVRSGRDPAHVTLIAVTKYAEPVWIRALLNLGERRLGENRPQQLAARAAEFPQEIQWHLIGHLQRNKAALAVRHAALVHSVDSRRLLEALQAEASRAGRVLPVLLEINMSGEAQKHGFSPTELEREFDSLQGWPHLAIQGLMTMAAQAESAEDSRPAFRGLRELRDRLVPRCQPGTKLEQLSMGMSGDFEPAIEEGATLIRIGSALWEGLEATAAT